jgi:tetratricopeptide (TPR) repeat protein
VANWQQYAEWYETALQESERYELYFGLGNLYYNTGCYLKAEENYKRVIELNDHFAKGY